MRPLSELENAVRSRLASQGASGVRRVACHVGGEEVLLFVRGGELRAVCTCSRDQCEHYQRALFWLCGAEDGLEAGDDPRLRTSQRPSTPVPVDHTALADAVDGLLLSVVRAGVTGASSPSVRDAIDQVVVRAPTPLPLGLSRFLGRLNDALSRQDVGKTARVLEGARRFADALREERPSSENQARRFAWLGTGAFGARALEPMEDAMLLEVGRERVAGLQRNAIERRYFVHLKKLEVVREEHLRTDAEASVGPCPRLLHVAFGELEQFGVPRRARLLQYAVAAELTDAHWTLVEPVVQSSVRELRRRYVAAVQQCPAQSEPFVIFAPAELQEEPRAALVDAQGEHLGLPEEAEQPLADVLRHLAKEATLVWVAGRLMSLSRGLVLRPVSALLKRGDGLHFVRIT
jgi:hypothetical protein